MREKAQQQPPRFDSVTIYEFPIGIGDNPATREGVPIALSSGKYVSKETLDVDIYEHLREGKRRKSKSLYLPVEDRAAMLLSRGYSLDKIVKRVLEMEGIKKSRAESLKMNGWERLSSGIDAAGKTLRKLNLNKKPKAGDRNIDKPNEVQARMA